MGDLAIEAAIELAKWANEKLKEKERELDEENARIEAKLKEQREWKAAHPGRQPQ